MYKCITAGLLNSREWAYFISEVTVSGVERKRLLGTLMVHSIDENLDGHKVNKKKREHVEFLLVSLPHLDEEDNVNKTDQAPALVREAIKK